MAVLLHFSIFCFFFFLIIRSQLPSVSRRVLLRPKNQLGGRGCVFLLPLRELPLPFATLSSINDSVSVNQGHLYSCSAVAT